MNHDLETGIKWYLVFIISTSFHEAAHAWSGWKLGDDTAHRGGQVTLDPTPHIRRAPIGMVVVPILSYILSGWMMGWASAPYNPQWAIKYPKRSALMSLAGPAANLIMVILAAIAIRVGIALAYFQAPDSVTFSQIVASETSGGYFFATLLSIVFSLNLILCAFNLLPVPPLDGSGALLGLTDSTTSEKFLETLQNPNFRFIGLLIAWKLFDMIYPPIQIFAINLLYLGQAHYQT